MLAASDERDQPRDGRRREHPAGVLAQKRKRRGPPPFTLQPGFAFSYRDPTVLRQFVSDQGKILPRRITGLTRKQQRELTRAIKRARVLALLPYSNR